MYAERALPIEDSEDAVSVTSEAEFNLHHTTPLQTYVHLLKGYVGPGCLSLPWAFSKLGITLGLVTVAGLGYVTSYNCLSILRAKRLLEARGLGGGEVGADSRRAGGSDGRDQSGVEDGADVEENNGGAGFTYSDIGDFAYGYRFRQYVTTSVVVQQLAVCTVFFSFVGDNLSAVSRTFMSASSPLANPRVVITLMLPAALALSCIPDLRALAPVMVLATGFLFAGFGTFGGVIGDNWGQHDDDGDIEVSWATVPLAMCAVMYSFEGICLILPVESAMKEPNKFKSTFKAAMVSVSIIFGAFATVCVLAFGIVDDGSITAFLMGERDQLSGYTLVLVANTVFGLSVVFTYPLQLFPTYEMVGQLISRRARRRQSHIAESRVGDVGVTSVSLSNVHFARLNGDSPAGLVDAEGVVDDGKIGDGGGSETDAGKGEDTPLIRAFLVLVTYVTAIAIPNVQQLISLAGALAGSSVALIIPPLVDLRFVIEFNQRLSMPAMKCYFLLLVGIVFGVIVTVASVVDIAKVYAN